MDQDQSNVKASKTVKIHTSAPGIPSGKKCTKIPGYNYGRTQCWLAFWLAFIVMVIYSIVK